MCIYPSWILIIKGDYKYIRHLAENEIEEVYNLKTDSEELINLAVEPKFHAKLMVLRKEFEVEFVDNLLANLKEEDLFIRRKSIYYEN